MMRPPPRSTRTHPLLPDTTLFRSGRDVIVSCAIDLPIARTRTGSSPGLGSTSTEARHANAAGAHVRITRQHETRRSESLSPLGYRVGDRLRDHVPGDVHHDPLTRSFLPKHQQRLDDLDDGAAHGAGDDGGHAKHVSLRSEEKTSDIQYL